MAYQPLSKPRFETRNDNAGEYIRIKAARQWFAILFLPIWLAGWTAGGFAAMTQLAQQFSAFLAFWLCGWALGWVAVSATLGWMLFGAETLRVINSDLEIGIVVGPLRHRKLYDGRQIRRLKTSPAVSPFGNFRLNVPFLPGARWGSVQFDYGARTVRFAGSLDEAEGELIVQYLHVRLPVSSRI